MSAFYNEHDPKAAAWLRELIKAGIIAPGIVDERSITDLSPKDLEPYAQCHFFAGIGGWSYALRLAGIPDSVPVWTGSCPCQPFSAAGKQKGTQDERHLWPSFARLIDARRPATVFGEQVASKDGRLWLAGVFADLEGMGYSRAGADLCSAGVGAPHIRQRLFWVADSAGARRERQERHAESETRHETRVQLPCASGQAGPLAIPDSRGREPRNTEAGPRAATLLAGQSGEDTNRLEHAASNRREQRRTESSGRGIACGCGACRLDVSDDERCQAGTGTGTGTEPQSFWSSAALLSCTDGKQRRFKPGIFPLAHGIPGRVGLLRGSGNAICPQVAAEFIQAFYEAIA